jgi:hypothetical protein
MQLFKYVFRISFAAIFAVTLSGCATTISPEEQKNYSRLVPKENTGGMVNSTMISKIDGESFYSMAGTAQEVLPGKHQITITSCFGSSSNCRDRYYALETKAGFIYVFKGNDVDVYNRFETSKRLETLENIMRQ